MNKLISSGIKMIAARLLMLTVGTFAFIYTHIKFVARSIRKKSWTHFRDNMANYYWLLAFSDDQRGNVIAKEVFNDFFLKNALGRLEYGKPDHTVSHVTGKNEQKDLLTFWGRFLAAILNLIDKGHTRRAANNPQYNG